MNFNKTLQTVIIAVLAIALFIGAICGIVHWESAPRKIKDHETIVWLENTDPDKYADVKADISLIVEDKYDITPEHLAFKVSSSSYTYCTYVLKVWFKDTDGTWYWQDFSWWNDAISPELDKDLCAIFRGTYDK